MRKKRLLLLESPDDKDFRISTEVVLVDCDVDVEEDELQRKLKTTRATTNPKMKENKTDFF